MGLLLRRVTNLRSHLAAAVPPQNQILLLGPPYKVPKNTTLQSEEILNALRLGDMEDDPIQEDVTKPRTLLTRSERSGAKRLFLFSKLDLSENAPDPPICHLEPTTLTLPTEAPGPSPLSLDPSGAPPLHLPLFAFERQFMLHMSQGRVLADGADLRMAACRSCVQEQAVMARSLRAAVSNLSDHYHGAARTRAEFTANFQAKTSAHGALLQRFDSILSNLATIPLHPSLVSIARAAGRNMDNLLDTVPVERERAWATQCLHSHQRLLSLFGELEITFNQLASPSSREDIAQRDHDAENEINNLWSKVEEAVQNINEAQAQRLDMLRNAHRDAVQRITHAMNSQSDDEIQNVFTPLREMSNSTKDLVSQMRKDDEQLKELMASVADAKNRMMRRMKARLREVSVAQSSIQKVLSSVGVLREALVQQAENMIHLEHVSELPESYRVFLSELRRRRAYGQAVMASATAMMDRVAAMRDDEVRAREKFLRGAGRHLMPAFYDIFVPTLATPPPLFTPQLPALVELDTIPNVGMSSAADSAADALMQQSATVAEQGGGSASTLTTESHHPQQSANMMTSAAVAGQEPAQQPEHLIVSADEQSGDEIILDPASNTAIEAEAKTLAYENCILRQTLERLGAKPPRAYIEEARAKDGAADVAGEEVVALRKELDKTKVLLEKATHQLEASNQLNDKISHSSFRIGDVGLFMPTGRGTGGKRMYLAFHTNCPHRYLSTDCIKGSPDFVLGRIIYQEELVAGEIGTDANPYGLHVGTKFWVLTVEVLKSSQ
ncbi:hypothetical protein FisN_4Lh375 [Fistulifera solaris]|uniref:Uncharacterized protein n=1 Tax=Fistulifera solaris TaxID=1519565 RepID=A0A1Z5JZX4_FISSO|nr:hypothetical protein FisN_4Lh375 [Fistulifera solaris]|eukprot:GAX19396.1 hypothetical protein FisN_4Lh375 [Fistulifera solaris]